jgi:predicted enzyme related to lactoylglutathione lyase
MAAKSKKRVATKVKPVKKLAKAKPAAKKLAKPKPAARKAKKPAPKPVVKKKPARKAKPAPKAKAPKPAPSEAVPPGHFVWREYASSDVPATVAFYTALFGWTTEEQDMGPMGKYTLFKSGDSQVAGVMSMPGVHPHWRQYCTVPSVDSAVETAKGLGGTIVVPPTDIPTVGRFAAVNDLQHAGLCPFTPSMPGSPPAGPPPAGTFCWDELMTSDPQAALSFYKAIYGWTTSTMELPNGPYHVLYAGAAMVGGIMKAPMPEVPSHWMSHVAVADLDAALAKASSLGAKIIVPPTPVPNMGKFAVVLDPAGADFALFQGGA